MISSSFGSNIRKWFKFWNKKVSTLYAFILFHVQGRELQHIVGRMSWFNFQNQCWFKLPRASFHHSMLDKMHSMIWTSCHFKSLTTLLLYHIRWLTTILSRSYYFIIVVGFLKWCGLYSNEEHYTKHPNAIS